MGLIDGIKYNLRGFLFGIRTPNLLFWGLIRFVMVIIITIVSASLILMHHQKILGLMWDEPESMWVLWLWHVLSWLLSLILVGVAAILSYLISQILFSVVIMDRTCSTTLAARGATKRLVVVLKERAERASDAAGRQSVAASREVCEAAPLQTTESDARRPVKVS